MPQTEKYIKYVLSSAPGNGRRGQLGVYLKKAEGFQWAVWPVPLEWPMVQL